MYGVKCKIKEMFLCSKLDTSVVPEIPDLTKRKKKKKLGKKFLDVVFLQLDTLFPTMFSSFRTLFRVRTVEPLTADSTSSLLTNLLPTSHFVDFGKRKSSESAKIDE